MEILGIILFCIIASIPARALWERTPGIDAEHGAPLSDEVCAGITESQTREASNNLDW